MKSNKNILMTGCAGFIGSHALDYFLEKQYKVFGVDNLTYAGKMENLNHNLNHKDFSFMKVDISDYSKIDKICGENKIDWIVNFAAETHVDNSIQSSHQFIDSNIRGIHSLLESCRKHKIKLFHVSTDEVYGDIKEGSYVEKDKMNPKNPYSATKSSAEHFVTSYANTYGVEYLIVRPSNNFGPRQHSEKLLPTVIGKILSNDKIPIYGDGRNIREWTYVKDTVKSIEYILQNSSLNEVYNISHNLEKENLTIVKKVCDIMDADFNKKIVFIEDRLGHDFRYSVNSDKLINLGFNFNCDFDKNLQETIEYYKNNL